jgi:hypothetical protein
MNNNSIFETMLSRNYIPLGMYRLVEKQEAPRILHSVGMHPIIKRLNH